MRMRFTIPFAATVVCGLCWAVATPAQELKVGEYSSPVHEVEEARDQMVAMRDGVRLAVDLYRPAGPGRFPVILIHTGYGKQGGGSWFGPGRARWFARRGYVFAKSDFRGRFHSEGEFDIFSPKHKEDGYDLVEWLAKQPWSTGNVGMTGPSYMGWSQWWAASQAPPSLKAIAPEVAPPDQLFNGPYQNGVLVCWAMDWGAGMMAGRTNMSIGPGAYGGFANSREADYRKLPYVNLPAVKGAAPGSTPWFETWMRQNLASDDYWSAISYQGERNYSKITVPSLNITGWFDANFPGSPMNYVGMKRFGATPEARSPRLVIGPWSHAINTRSAAGIDYGAQAVIDLDGLICRWFDHYLKGQENGIDREAPVNLFVMGANRWQAETDWPLPQTRWTKYYLHSQGAANGSGGDGVLNIEPPADEPADSYVYDPADPTPDPYDKGLDGRTLAVRRIGHIEGAVDTRNSALRPDVLVYTSPPLESDTEVTGPIEAKLYAATSARDTDWMVRLIDVHPDGYAALLGEGILRARHRDPDQAGTFNPNRLSDIDPDRVYEYTLHFWRPTANVFQMGHRIRIEISSSYFPYYLPNLNTGADRIGLETKAVIAKQTVLHSAEFPSHVVLPVIPRRDAVE